MSSRLGIGKILASLAFACVTTLANATPVVLNITQSTQAPVGLQNSSVGSFTELTPTPGSFAINTDFKFLIGVPGPVGLGSGTGLAFSLVGVGTQGCAASDFVGFQVGSILVTDDSSCLFSTIVNNAANAGAVGVAIGFGGDVFNSTFGLVDATTIPSLIATTAVINGIVAQLGSAPVPEPGSIALMLLGLVVFGQFTFRKSVART